MKRKYKKKPGIDYVQLTDLLLFYFIPVQDIIMIDSRVTTDEKLLRINLSDDDDCLSSSSMYQTEY